MECPPLRVESGERRLRCVTFPTADTATAAILELAPWEGDHFWSPEWRNSAVRNDRPPESQVAYPTKKGPTVPLLQGLFTRLAYALCLIIYSEKGWPLF